MRIKLRLSFKLFLAILAACVLVLVVNAVFVRISFVRDFMGYLNEQGVQRMQEVIPRINAAYASHFSDPLPVRATVCTELVAPARIEIAVVAALRG